LAPPTVGEPVGKAAGLLALAAGFQGIGHREQIHRLAGIVQGLGGGEDLAMVGAVEVAGADGAFDAVEHRAAVGQDRAEQAVLRLEGVGRQVAQVGAFMLRPPVVLVLEDLGEALGPHQEVDVRNEGRASVVARRLAGQEVGVGADLEEPPPGEAFRAGGVAEWLARQLGGFRPPGLDGCFP
jgi:hypothetical protein